MSMKIPNLADLADLLPVLWWEGCSPDMVGVEVSASLYFSQHW